MTLGGLPRPLRVAVLAFAVLGLGVPGDAQGADPSPGVSSLAQGSGEYDEWDAAAQGLEGALAQRDELSRDRVWPAADKAATFRRAADELRELTVPEALEGARAMALRGLEMIANAFAAEAAGAMGRAQAQREAGQQALRAAQAEVRAQRVRKQSGGLKR